MKMKFIGCGSAFNKINGQSNLMITSESNKKLLIDCGSYFWKDSNLDYGDIDALYVTHLHADHIGGIEELAFCTYFNPTLEKPKLFCNKNLMKDLWEESLRGGLESIQGKIVTLTEYFDCYPIENSKTFEWENIKFTPVQSVHVMSAYHIKHSYGLIIQEITEGGNFNTNEGTLNYKPKIFFTSDTQHCPNQIMDFYKEADIIFQDCETSPFKSGVHAHYSELKELSNEIKNKMWLYHYQPNPSQNVKSEDDIKEVEKDGFIGFVQKDSEWDFSSSESSRLKI